MLDFLLRSGFTLSACLLSHTFLFYIPLIAAAAGITAGLHTNVKFTFGTHAGAILLTHLVTTSLVFLTAFVVTRFTDKPSTALEFRPHHVAVILVHTSYIFLVAYTWATPLQDAAIIVAVSLFSPVVTLPFIFTSACGIRWLRVSRE